MAASKSRISSKQRVPSKGKIAARMQRPLVFGMVVASGAEGLGAKVEKLLRWTSKQTGVEISLGEAPSYEQLAKEVRASRVDVAWLPPIVRLRLGGEVSALGSILRDGRITYETALIVRKDSKAKTIAQLKDARAGWVDRWSAAGFVLPRVNLALFGIDPRTFFRTETFFGSHRGVVEALRDGACDVAGTYAQADVKGKVKGGSWSEIEGADVRVLATFGAIPPDVIATRADLAEGHVSAIRDSLRAASVDEQGRRLLRAVFGGEAFVEDMAKSYESLARALDMASARGLFA
ncbi:MAG: PhnD/SsuA/transferrin family substrate-binding protein [Labilithrix sp.]|nr:PhnD/SsuA/transferrin family substrate-binding protein [Labilithrix sp.]